MTEVPDEVSYSDFRQACARIKRLGERMAGAEPDELAEHYLPDLSKQYALVFSFTGSNMTARHLPLYHRTLAELEAAKDRASPVPQGEEP